MEKLPLGKLPKNVLIENVLSFSYVKDDVLLPPSYGEDGAVVRTKGNLIIAAADPITGASEEAGWLSVHVNANDIAVHAAYPKWYIVTLLFPENTMVDDIEKVMNGIRRALNEIDGSLIGGHTEITNKVNDIIIAGTMIGEPIIPGEYITSSGAKVGDDIVLTKGAGIEGTFILATDFENELRKRIDEQIIDNAKRFREKISILPEVQIITENVDIEHIHAMHDVTEGGLIGGVFEIAYASNLSFRIYEEKVPILEPTEEICKFYHIDPLKLIGSGALLISVDSEISDEVINALNKAGIYAATIGKFEKRWDHIGVLVRKNGDEHIIDEPPIDELWRLLGLMSI